MGKSTFLETNIGSPHQRAILEELQPGITEVVDQIADLATHVVSATPKTHNLTDEVLFSLSRVCIEEYYELLLLAANQYDVGATKTLRSLYERVVTFVYINRYPEKADRFVRYGVIQQHRVIYAAKKVLSDKEFDAVMPPKKMEELEKQYEQVKGEFRKTKCKPCGKTESAHSWDIDLASMCEKAGEGLSKLYFIAYAMPTLKAHTTYDSTFSRVSISEEDLVFDYGPNSRNIIMCLVVGTTLLNLVLKKTIERFSLRFEEPMQKLEDRIRKHFAIERE